MADIRNLVEDVERVLDPRTHVKLDPDASAELARQITSKVEGALTRTRAGSRHPKTIFASELGKPCHRQTWYGYHRPELGEVLRPSNILKFLYGDILEELLLYLARLAGHKVEAEQQRVEIPLRDGWKITGRIDAVIDGQVADVKSTSPYGFDEMTGGKEFKDKFGYETQVATYREWAERNGLVSSESSNFLFIVDKQNGTLGLRECPDQDVISKGETLVDVLENDKEPPPRGFEDEPTTNGNRKLVTECGYCAYKKECWPDLRGFAYARGPVWLTVVNKVPKDVPEIHFNKEIV